MSLYGPARGEAVLPSGTGMLSLPTTSTNMYGRGVAVSRMHVGTTASVSSMPIVDLMMSLLESPNIPQSPPPWTLLYAVYPQSGTFSQPFSGSLPHFGCRILGGGGTLLRQSASGT